MMLIVEIYVHICDLVIVDDRAKMVGKERTLYLALRNVGSVITIDRLVISRSAYVREGLCLYSRLSS